MAHHADVEAQGPPPFDLPLGTYVCQVEGLAPPFGVWVADRDLTGQRDSSGQPYNGITCRQMTVTELLLYGRKLYKVARLLVELPLIG